MAWRPLLALLALCLGTLPCLANPPRTPLMSNAAQNYLVAFRNGDAFSRPAKGLVVNGQIDAGVLPTLGQALATDSPQVREKLVALLVDLALQVDPMTRRGTEAVRHPQVIELLAGPGLEKADVGRDAAMEALRKLVTVPDLARFGLAFVKALEDEPTAEAFLLVAKAKPPGAKPVVDRLAQWPKLMKLEAVRVARAALGARDIEDEFLAVVESAPDGPALARAVGTLGLVGTPRSLQAVALQLRTPMTIHKVGTFEKSVRLNVLEALLYNYPDRPELYPNNILGPANYAAAEAFAISALGVRYSAPVPPFLTYRGYPIPSR